MKTNKYERIRLAAARGGILKRMMVAVIPLAVAAVGCRSPGPYERSFRPTVVAPEPVSDNVPDGSIPLDLSAPAVETTFVIPDEPVIPESSIQAYELVSPGDVTNWWAAGHSELGRSEFVGELADRAEAVSLAARLGAPVVLFHATDLGERYVWQTVYESRVVPDFWPPPPRRDHRRHGPPPPHFHTETIPVERIRVLHLFAQGAVFLSPDSPPTARTEDAP